MATSINPYQEFKAWLTDNNKNSELNPEVLKAIYVFTALVMFCRLGATTIYLNKMFNNVNLYNKDLQEKKLEFFKELKIIAHYKKISPWDFSYISLKKQKFDYSHLQSLFPYLKKYEIELLVTIMKNKDDKQFLNIALEKEPTKRKLSKADEKLFK